VKEYPNEPFIVSNILCSARYAGKNLVSRKVALKSFKVTKTLKGQRKAKAEINTRDWYS